MILTKARLLAGGGLVAAGLVAGLTINAWRYEAKLSQLEAEHAATMQAISDEAQRATSAVMRDLEAAQERVALIDARYTEELSHAESENDRLRDAVASGERRLRIAASCPADSDRVPEASGTTGQPDDGTVEVSREVGRAVFNLRRDLIQDRAKILGLQAYIRDACRP